MSQPPDLRASDADRERTADALRRHAAEGRLDPAELDERLSARTHGELERLTTDLPALDPAAAPAPRRRVPREVVDGAISFVAVNLVCVLVWLATGADASFWPGWVLLGTGIALIARVASALRDRDDEIG